MFYIFPIKAILYGPEKKEEKKQQKNKNRNNL